jgi:hypothetical protein
LPKKPTDVELKVMKEMFEASVDGKAFDMERWGQYFRPAGMQAPAGAAADADEDVPVAKPAPVAKAPVDDLDDEDTPVATAPVAKPAEGNKKAEDILAMIRSRQNK